MDRQFKRSKKGAVQLTSLLDLLFVMIFVSLLQQKEVAPTPTKTETKVVEKIVEKEVIKIVEIEKPQVKKPEKIIHSMSATFDFYGAGYKGKYLMEGVYNKNTRRLNLSSVSWIDKPALDIGMVPLSGTVSDDKMTFTGRVEFEGCKTFNLKRIKTAEGSLLAGQWKGSYVCVQGSTGLTLTIK